MAITYPLTMPATPSFRAIRWRTQSVVASNRSPFTLTEDVQVWAGQNWMAELSLPPMKRPDAEAWIAFLLSLNGKQGTFYLADPTAKTPRGSVPGAPLVDGTQAGGAQTLATKGWTASQANVLLPGDWIQLGTGATARLHKNLTAANSDGAGKATLDIWPSIRKEGATNSAAIVTSNCKGVFRLDSNSASWDVGEAQIYGLDFSAVGTL